MSDKRVIHTGDLQWETDAAGAFFAARRRRLSRPAGARDLDCAMIELAPGKTASPFHFHAANEEVLYVLDGHGTLRLGDARLPVRGGDFVAFPAGPDAPHQLTNTGDAPLRYLLVATRRRPDVVVMPDSHKVGIVDDPAGGDERYFSTDSAVDRWEGEPIGEPDDAPTAPGRDPTEKADAAETARQREEIERKIDAEIEQMKQRLEREASDTGSKSTTPPASATPDDIDALKRKLEDD
jgi:uncharacterized cupin superfamily protein